MVEGEPMSSQTPKSEFEPAVEHSVGNTVDTIREMPIDERRKLVEAKHGNQTDDQTEPKEPKESERKVHQTHFTVTENPLRGNGYDNGYEWVDCGNGHWKRVHKKAKT